jgi:hypothetical protein
MENSIPMKKSAEKREIEVKSWVNFFHTILIKNPDPYFCVACMDMSICETTLLFVLQFFPNISRCIVLFVHILGILQGSATIFHAVEAKIKTEGP